VQYRETDFDFASRLMEDEGIFYFFEHRLFQQRANHIMCLATAFDSAWSVSGHVLFRSVRAGAPGLGVDGWEKSQELRSGKYTVRDHNFEMTGKSLEDKKTIVQAKGAGLVQAGQVPHHVSLGGNHEMELYDYPGGYAKRYDEVAFLGGGDQAPFQ